MNNYFEFQNQNTLANHKVSYTSKRSSDWKWLKNWTDYYINANPYVCDDEYEKIALNYRLWNGRGVVTQAPRSPIDSVLMEEGEGYLYADEDIPHLDILIPIGKSLCGQQQLMPLNPIVTDSSVFNINDIKLKKQEIYKNFIQSNILKPIQEQAYRQWSIENNIQDMAMLSPEQQQEAKQQIDERARLNTPEDIERFMSNKYKSPSETQLKQILEYVLRRDDIKYWTDENFKHMIISGKQIYDTGVRNNKAFFKIINPLDFRYGGPPSAHFIEDNDYGIHRELLTIPQLFDDHGIELNSSNIKKIENLIGSNSARNNRGEFPEPMNSMVAEYDAQTGFFDHIPSPKTKEGQEFLRGIYSKFGNGQEYTVERHRVVFSSLRDYKLVDRYDNKTNKYSQFWVDGSYEQNPHKDIRCRTVWLKHMYQCEKIGYGSDALYLNKGSLPNQHLAFNDPTNVKLPFIGIEYSKLFGNTENVAPLDLGKPWQNKFNLQLAKITEIEATDLGNILAVSQNYKPEGWSFGKWLMMAKYGKLLPLDTTNSSVNNLDTQVFKNLSTGQMQDLAAKIQYADWIRTQAALAMSYNPQRLGQIISTEAVRNSQQNIQQSTYQTQDLYTIHNMVLERLIQRHVMNERVALKDNNYVASYILDDMSRSILEVDNELFDSAVIGIVIKNNSEEFNALRAIKADSQALLQNSLITFSDYVKLQNTKNMADAINISEHAEEKMRKIQQDNQAAQAEQAKQIEAMKKEMQDLALKFEAEQKQLDRDNKIDVASISSMSLKNQMDANANNQSDLIEKEILVGELEKQEKVKDREHELKLQDLNAKLAIKLKEIEVKNKNLSKK